MLALNTKKGESPIFYAELVDMDDMSTELLMGDISADVQGAYSALLRLSARRYHAARVQMDKAKEV